MSSYENARSRLQGYVGESDDDLTAKLLGALLEHAPTVAGRKFVADEIALCNNAVKLRELSSRYLYGLIVPMRGAGGRTPAVSDHPSKRSVAIDVANMEHLIEAAKRDQATLKKLCLRRDNFRCVVSGHVDYQSDLDELVDVPEGVFSANTVAAHIIPFSIAAKSEKAANVKKTSAVFEILEHFGGVKLEELNGNQINRVENVITLTDAVHHVFGRLHIWLDPVEGQKDSYFLRKAHPRSLSIPDGTIITFRQGDPRIPLPDPRFIAIHAACAKIAHASGAAEIIDRYLRDYEEIKVLASDGSSSQLLHSALKMISIV